MAARTVMKDHPAEARTRPARPQFLDVNTYHPVYSVVISSLDGTDRFDHLVVSRYGVFVIESGSHSGSIRGDASSPRWTAVYANGARHRFPNPLQGDREGLARLTGALGVPAERLFPVIVFRGDCELAAGVPDNVVKADPAPFIRSRKRLVFTEEEVAGLRTRLRDLEKKATLFANRHPWQAR